ncbi:MAG: hypothetical protein SVM86_05770 [Candidatus Cloacimonadota bacterium]|nr:hypothetical protein [Candidatus Cloacimonadota bacterium]
MEKVNIKKLCAAIVKVCKNAPITYINESIIIFRGQKIEIKGNKATSLYFDFTFGSAQDFIENLRNNGLMLSHSEYYKIIQEYGN